MVIDAREKNKKGKGIGSIREGCGQILGSGKLSLKNNVWEKLRGGKGDPGEGRGKCKGPEEGV